MAKQAAQPPQDGAGAASRAPAQAAVQTTQTASIIQSGKTKCTASAARRAALECGVQVRKRAAFVRDILPQILSQFNLDARDKAFASRLALGVSQTQGTLDEALNRCMRSPKDARPNLRDALRISAYELLFLRKDAYAAVNQGVELAAFVSPKARGLANAILRKLAAAASEFPFGNPETDMAAFARLQGFPEWLAQNLVDWLDEAAARRFMEASNTPPPLFASVNFLKATFAQISETLQAADIDFAAYSPEGKYAPGCVKFAEPSAIAAPAARDLVKNGKLIISDGAPQAIAAAISALPARSLLEIGAGRGTKTALIQSDSQHIFGAQIPNLVCVDNVASKARLLRERAAQCGANVVQIVTADASDAANLDAAIPKNPFDVVFIDAPCTGLGTLRRHPEIRWRITPADIAAAAALDARLLQAAAAHIAPRGFLAYSTCTVTPQENAQVIEEFLATPVGGAFGLMNIGGDRYFQTRLAPDGPDSHFLAILRRNA